MVGVIVMPLNIDYHETDQKWKHGNWVCALWVVSDTLASTASIWTLVIIAIDRLAAVVFPIKYMNLSWVSALIGLVIVWILSLSLCVPPIVFPEESIDYDYCRHTQKPWFLIYSALGAFYIPLTILILAYGKIFFELRKKMKQKKSRMRQGFEMETVGSRGDFEIVTPIMSFRNTLQRIGNTLSLPATMIHGNNSTATSSIQLSQDDNNQDHARSDQNLPFNRGNKISMQSTCNSKIIAQRERKVLVQMGVLVVAFLICWLPFWVLFSVLPICLPLEFCEFTSALSTLSTVFQWLSYANSMINPVVYTIFNRDFRIAGTKAIGLCRKCGT
ncbi:5-hydroxytryptamine receptor 1D-like isoform X2 [Tigriopus californicus]|nr:5-hydroxytryptamine receptor 1D-like isoform X2 [Tigriopus californicus]